MKQRLITLLICMLCVFMIYGCKTRKKDETEPLFYENVMEVRVFRHERAVQKILIPLVFSKEVDKISVTDILGENIDKDSIVVETTNCTASNGYYLSFLTMSFDWEKYNYKDDVKINSLKLNIDGNDHEYKPGTFEIITKTGDYSDDSVSFESIGTGYSELSSFAFGLSFNDDIKIKKINNTINLHFDNENEYIQKNYYKGNKCEFKLVVDDSKHDKLYYMFDISVIYEKEGKEYAYYFDILQPSTNIEERLSEYIKTDK